jgi:hypothetical protein
MIRKCRRKECKIDINVKKDNHYKFKNLLNDRIIEYYCESCGKDLFTDGALQNNYVCANLNIYINMGHKDIYAVIYNDVLCFNLNYQGDKKELKIHEYLKSKDIYLISECKDDLKKLLKELIL